MRGRRKRSGTNFRVADFIMFGIRPVFLVMYVFRTLYFVFI